MRIVEGDQSYCYVHLPGCWFWSLGAQVWKQCAYITKRTSLDICLYVARLSGYITLDYMAQL